MNAPMWTSVGEADLLVVEDGICSYEPGFPFAAFDDLPVDQLPEEIRARLDDDGYLPIPYNPTLIRIAGATVLVDFGAGHELAREWEEPVGRAADSLAAAGVARDEIGVAVITHAHPDHVPGFTELVDGERIPTFPQARHVISKTEWRYWVDEDPGEPSAGMVPMVRPSLTALRDAGVLDLVEGDEEIADGVTLLPTPGHTPGHMSVLVTSGDATCIVAGDVVLTEWAFEHPEWTAIPEVDPQLVVRSRRALFDRLVASGGLLAAFHLPELGRIEAAGDVYLFVPA